MELLGDLAGNIAGDTVEKLILFMAGWLVEVFSTMLDFVGTWWLNIGAPEMGAGSATERVQSATTTFVGVAGIIGTAFAVIRVARDHNRESAENLVMGLIRTVVVSGLAVSMVALSLEVTDEVAPWLVDTIAGNAARDGLGQAMGLDTLVGTGMALTTAGILLVLAPFAILGAILNAALVIFSYGVAGALCGILPIFAAASTTERGRKAFDKAVGWLISVILFKPVAAVLYGFGLALMNGITGTAEDEVANKIITLLTGTVIIFSACLAMPALARVMVPAVSAGPRGMGAGGLAMLGGAVAIGALTAGVGTAAAGAAAAGAGATGTGGAAGAAGAGAAGAGSAGAGGAAGAGSGATGALSGGTGGGFSGAGASGGSSATGAQASGSGGGAGGGSPTAGGPGGAQNVETTSTGADSASAPGTTSGGASGAETVQATSTGAAPTSAPGSTSGGASGAENVQSSTSGAPTPGSSSTSTGSGPAGTEQVQNSSPSPAAAGGASEAAGPVGAEPVAATAGAGPAGHPAGEGGPATGAKKPLINGQRLEFGLREVVRDAEQSIESGEDL
ncbi:hypothetical protein [Kocuria rosea]|uniref:hypothetical protein n=1 Tax=Kocuria rosea TaxID=1275 RepID=UPI002B243605|nr:hypothetical protein [Kocuria rosea]MEB2529133.1 hypothetical protein [Kocuria rosea]MEB2619769.1 hypothetical protein [Kocuria rosea]